MNDIYRFKVSVTPPGPGHVVYEQWFDLHFVVAMQHELQPIDRCSDTQTAFICGGKSPEQARLVDAHREQYVEQLSKRLSTELIDLLLAQDTKNGYKQV